MKADASPRRRAPHLKGEPVMDFRGQKRRPLWVACGIGGVSLLIVGAVAAVSKLDLERHASDAERLEKLARMPLPSTGAAPSQGRGWPQWRGPNRDGAALDGGLAKTWPTAGPRVIWKELVGRG